MNDTLKEMSLPQGSLVMIVKRGTEFLVPNGSLHLQVRATSCCSSPRGRKGG